MSPLSAIRTLSFLITFAVAACAGKDFIAVVSVIAMVHYTVAIIYSRRQILSAFSRPFSAVLTGILSLSAFVMYAAKMKISFAFLPHHVFNEVYLEKKELFAGKEERVKWFTWSAVLLNVALYCVLNGQRTARVLIYSPEITRPLLLVGVICFALSLARLRPILSRRLVLDACMLELLSVAAIAIGHFHSISVWHIVLYHITFWGLYPLYKMYDRANIQPAQRYVFLNVTLLVVAWLISPLSFLPWHMSEEFMRAQFIFTSFFHIMTSFALSRAQPEWIWRIFQPPSSFAAVVQKSILSAQPQPQVVSSSR